MAKTKTKKDKLTYSKGVLDNQVLWDPYGQFYEEETLTDAELDRLTAIDDGDAIAYNPENFKKYVGVLAEQYTKEKKAWLGKAMQYDPAFMVDPVRDYYKKLLPKELVSTLSESELKEWIAIYDPVTWGEKYLLQKHGGWKPRCSQDGIPYQSMMIRTKAKRVCGRAGRRVGKSGSIAARVLHKAFTWQTDGKKPTFNIVIFTPNIRQIQVIFKMMEVLVDNHPLLMSMVVNGKIPTKQNPQYCLELTNGVSITGFVSGSTSIRGSAADILWLDEGSYLTDEDVQAVISLLNEHKNVELIVTSTPKGLKDWFYDRSFDPTYVTFHFPSDKFHPGWSKQMEHDFRTNLTDAAYKFEVLADFAADGEGVFQRPFIEAAKTDYSLVSQYRKANCVYGLGADWNDTANGTKIYVVEFDKMRAKYRVVDTESVSIEGWTQTVAVQKVKEMNRKWVCDFIYVDTGFGHMQIESLHEIGAKSPFKSIDRRLLKVKGVSFKSKLTTYDPWTKQQVSKETKVFMVNNAVRIFENKLIEIPQDSTMLLNQLETYYVDRITPTGNPVYAKDPKYGDHELDALMICLLGFTMEYSSIGKLPTGPLVALSPNAQPNMGLPAELHGVDDTGIIERHLNMLKDKQNDKNEVEAAGGTTTSLYSNEPIGTKGVFPAERRTTPLRQGFFKNRGKGVIRAHKTPSRTTF